MWGRACLEPRYPWAKEPLPAVNRCDPKACGLLSYQIDGRFLIRRSVRRFLGRAHHSLNQWQRCGAIPGMSRHRDARPSNPMIRQATPLRSSAESHDRTVLRRPRKACRRFASRSRRSDGREIEQKAQDNQGHKNDNRQHEVKRSHHDASLMVASDQPVAFIVQNVARPRSSPSSLSLSCGIAFRTLAITRPNSLVRWPPHPLGQYFGDFPDAHRLTLIRDRFEDLVGAPIPSVPRLEVPVDVLRGGSVLYDAAWHSQ